MTSTGASGTPPAWALEDAWTGPCEVCGVGEAVVVTIWHHSKVTVRYCGAAACADDLRSGLIARAAASGDLSADAGTHEESS